MIQLYYRDQALPVIDRILMKTVFAAKEIEGSITYEADQKRDEAAEKAQKDGDGRGPPR